MTVVFLIKWVIRECVTNVSVYCPFDHQPFNYRPFEPFLTIIFLSVAVAYYRETFWQWYQYIVLLISSSFEPLLTVIFLSVAVLTCWLLSGTHLSSLTNTLLTVDHSNLNLTVAFYTCLLWLLPSVFWSFKSVRTRVNSKLFILFCQFLPSNLPLHVLYWLIDAWKKCCLSGIISGGFLSGNFVSATFLNLAILTADASTVVALTAAVLTVAHLTSCVFYSSNLCC